MKIKKRDNTLEQLSFDKIIYRLKKLCNDARLGKLETIDPDIVAQRVVSSIYDGVTSCELDEEAARIAVGMIENPEYPQLASRIVVSNLHKSTMECFSEVMEKLYNAIDANGNHMPVLSDLVIELVRKHKATLNFAIDYNRDYMFDYFGFKTLEKSYLLRVNGVIVERPQHMYMRVALGIHQDDIDSVLKTYEYISQHFYTHASPSLFNAGTRMSNLSSCFHEDTIVATVNRGPVKIKDVQLGDQVVTHLGNVKKVVQLHKNPLGERKLYELNVSKTAPIKVTDNHKLWVVKAEKNGMHTLKKTGKTNVYSKPKWTSVDDLQKGDYISIPNKRESIRYTTTLDIATFKDFIEKNPMKQCVLDCDEKTVTLTTHFTCKRGDIEYLNYRKHGVVNRFWSIDADFAKFIGIFYGNGHIITSKDTKGNQATRGIGITIHSKDVDLIEFCNRIGEKIFGINATLHKMKYQNVVQVLFNSALIGEIFEHLFGKYVDKKRLWSEMFKWDTHLVMSMVEGLITTDGCITESNVVSIQMSNVTFMRGLYYLLRNNNIDVSYGKEKRQKQGTQNHIQISIPYSAICKDNIDKCYNDMRIGQLPIKSCRNQYSPIAIDGFKFLKFEGKRQITDNLPEYVYTLGVEDDHSYNVEGIIAQNCFLLGSHDSIDGIYKTITDCARISKLGGGIGVHISDIRAKNSIIRGTNGTSDGIVPMIRVYNATALYVDQSSRRKGSFAMYLEPWHADIMPFLDLKKNQGHEDLRARDLFYALWTPDYFMEQVQCDGDWYLMCPDECPGLTESYGDDFKRLYLKYISENKYRKKVKAQDIWTRVMDSQIETGTPYICYKDSVNRKCNQKNIGTIKSSNLCAEISLYSDHLEYSVCTLCSIALPKYVYKDDEGNMKFDFEKLYTVSKYVIGPMNKVIDNNYYPTVETERSNFRHRPLGIGVQGLADVYIKMGLPFESEEAKQLNKDIFETLYYGCLTGSVELAKKDGPYETYKGSPFSEGKFQFDLAKEFDNLPDEPLTRLWDWEKLRKDMLKYGVRNSMLTALMPTASTAQIMGNSEAFEPIDSCIFKRRVLSGEYIVVNKYLVADLTRLGLWNKELKDTIIANNGSIQDIPHIPDKIKAIYKTVWEISMKSVIEQCRDRGLYVDQMQSMNLFMSSPNYKKLTSMHFYAFRNKLKTGMYYLRSKAAASAGKFSVDPHLEKAIRDKRERGETLEHEEEKILCSIENPESCLMCSS
ncbi:ribonucleoside-diphosphate reductase subunit alpha [bacterium]|nr:ribonucleoside-diphosphate reductase subunit alpha [bacterium]NDC94163.1 ribonucleoside-diphosphate reductase subunit alpha [bacterium]NDD82761.1 ribonucleoside-diphosphate reductase subunit alpha [bacterium]NDG29412.1 ribonucleoside-diphosphate reductase subunit alpha [bacterium]